MKCEYCGTECDERISGIHESVTCINALVKQRDDAYKLIGRAKADMQFFNDMRVERDAAWGQCDKAIARVEELETNLRKMTEAYKAIENAVRARLHRAHAAALTGAVQPATRCAVSEEGQGEDMSEIPMYPDVPRCTPTSSMTVSSSRSPTTRASKQSARAIRDRAEPMTKCDRREQLLLLAKDLENG